MYGSAQVPEMQMQSVLSVAYTIHKIKSNLI